MKKHLLLSLIVALVSLNLSAQTTLQKTQTIDALDTVVFDLSQAVINGSYVEFPVSFLSDDTITALDFSLKYNHSNLVFDSIIDLTNYMQAFSFYNANDSTIRFTSNSLQPYTKDTSLASIRFDLLTAQLSNLDLNTLKGYLNGSACSIKLVNVVPTGITEMMKVKLVSVYPNPVNEILNIHTSEKVTIELFDVNGKEIIFPIIIKENQNQMLNIQSVTNGVYMLKIRNSIFETTRKIVISK